ncbi:MAG: riboflavin synthase, partial [Roseovarius sp.]
MFTGIITDVGRIQAVEHRGDLRARIGTGYDTARIEIGASIACDGVCLTVVALGSGWFDVDISAETLSKTNLSGWAEGRRV